MPTQVSVLVSTSRTPVRTALRGLALTLIAGSALVACGDGGTGLYTPIVDHVVVTPASATLASLGETKQLTATARDGNEIDLVVVG